MLNAWSVQTSWTEVCQRANGRRRYHSIRRLQARLRRRQVARCLAREGLRYGVRARLARRFKVSKATITADVRAILVTPQGPLRQRRQGVRHLADTEPRHRRSLTKEEAMGQRSTVRLPNDLRMRLQ
jgi:hypothetical protein